jgi:hypothetical protein
MATSSSPLPASISTTILDKSSNHTQCYDTTPGCPCNSSTDITTYLLDEPSISASPTAVYAFLNSELSTPVLDELYPWLWLVGRKSGRSIDALHQQRAKSRIIIPVEDSKLHLVWYRNRIYVKPVPVCLMNHGFWKHYLPPLKDVRSSADRTQLDAASHFDCSIAVGFLRSYAFLIQHRIDLTLAHEHSLIPKDVDWARWCAFSSRFRDIEDEQVAKRYHYGQLRLSRLDWASRIFRPSTAKTVWFYEIPMWSIQSYVEQSIAPLVFIFGSFSLVLSSMQVVLSLPFDKRSFDYMDDASFQAACRAFFVFSIMVLFISFANWVLVLVIPLGILVWQLQWGYRNRGGVVRKTALSA